MKALGVAFTYEDMVRIAAAVGTMAVKMVKDADTDDDVKEAAELCKLHIKLVKTMEEAFTNAPE